MPEAIRGVNVLASRRREDRLSRTFNDRRSQEEDVDSKEVKVCLHIMSIPREPFNPGTSARCPILHVRGSGRLRG